MLKGEKERMRWNSEVERGDREFGERTWRRSGAIYDLCNLVLDFAFKSIILSNSLGTSTIWSRFRHTCTKEDITMGSETSSVAAERSAKLPCLLNGIQKPCHLFARKIINVETLESRDFVAAFFLITYHLVTKVGWGKKETRGLSTRKNEERLLPSRVQKSLVELNPSLCNFSSVISGLTNQNNRLPIKLLNRSL